MSQSKLKAALLGICLASVTAGGVWAADAAPVAEKPATTQPAKRPIEQIVADIRKAGEPLGDLLSTEAMTDAAKRQEVAPKAIPVLKHMVGLMQELIDSGDPSARENALQSQAQLQAFLAIFGDSGALDTLNANAKSANKADALRASESLVMVDWVKAGRDAAAQTKIVDRAEKLAKDNPEDEQLAGLLMSLSQLGTASPELVTRLEDAAAGMKTQSAQMIKSQLASTRKLRSMENKPLVIEGVKLDGSKFSTADWKGKVIFVDFWATWCGPCRAELPRVKKAYAQFHDKGLEVLGVSCDEDGKTLQEFLNNDKEMPWPQLFDVKNPGWHPLAKAYGIEGIPTMFLIDKKGVLRSVTARENFEEMIPKLLAE